MRPVVAIPVKNRLDLTKPLVEALRATGGPCDIIVFDNGSTDGTAEWLLSEGVGYSLADGWNLHEMWNRAVELAVSTGRFNHLVILNNDLKLDGKPDWVTRLCAPFDDGEEWDALCPNYDNSPVVSWRPVVRLRGIQKCKLDGTGGLAGFAFALSSRFLKTGYRFPADMKWWWGDADLVMTLDDQARPYGMVAGCGVEHIGGGSQTAKDHDLSAQMEADREVFEEKWGVMV